MGEGGEKVGLGFGGEEEEEGVPFGSVGSDKVGVMEMKSTAT